MRIPVVLEQHVARPGEALSTMTKTAAWDPHPQEREIAQQLVTQAVGEYRRSERRLRVLRRSGRPDGRYHVITQYLREVRGIVDPWLGTPWVPDPHLLLINAQQPGDSGSSSERTPIEKQNAHIVTQAYPHGCICVCDEPRNHLIPLLAHEYAHHIQHELVRSCNRRDAITRQSFEEEVASLHESEKTIHSSDLAGRLRNVTAFIGIVDEMTREARVRRRARDAFDFLCEGHARGVEMHVARRYARAERDGWYVWTASWNAIPDLWHAYAALSAAMGETPSAKLLPDAFWWLTQEIPDAQAGLSQYAYGIYQLRRLELERGDAAYRDLPAILFGPDDARRREFLERMRLNLDAIATVIGPSTRSAT